jgi:hypothetical protein
VTCYLTMCVPSGVHIYNEGLWGKKCGSMALIFRFSAIERIVSRMESGPDIRTCRLEKTKWRRKSIFWQDDECFQRKNVKRSIYFILLLLFFVLDHRASQFEHSGSPTGDSLVFGHREPPKIAVWIYREDNIWWRLTWWAAEPNSGDEQEG